MNCLDYLLFIVCCSFSFTGKVFTHEWGHLRWGLFDEYASVKDHFGIPIEFYLQKGNWEPVR